MLTSELQQLLDHMEWADALVWKVVNTLPAAEDDERVEHLLHHVHTVQWVYLRIWRDEPVVAPEVDHFPDLPALRGWGRAFYAELPAFTSALDQGSLDRTIEIPWAAQLAEEYGTVQPTDLRQSILQVASHSTYHRGQLNSRIREIGGEPPLTDSVAWIWKGRPQPEWEPSP